MTDREQRKDRFRDRLSEYIDGNLGVEEEVLVERHLERCEDCARTVVELEAVVDRAASLGPREPAEDLWPDIAARIAAPAAGLAGAAPDISEAPTRRRSPARRIARFAPQLAAGVALVWLSAALVWMAAAGDDIEGNAGSAGTVPGLGAPSLLPPAARSVSTLESTLEDGGSSAEEYARLISELERVLFESQRPLPPETVARIRRALVTIDRAIEDARAALLELPDDPYIQQHMENTMRRKSEFLVQAVQLAATD
ncbi:zf-HC2 domain-containing protein [Candidatus Palauibacter sp.]|uniref:zf-HC2 domain-containing protein n=1 Tax=Candidatus Palauibacter sp. TaxID=3101350 RepID=UPI003B52AE6E